MNFVLLFCVIASLSAADSTSENSQATILNYENDRDPKGNYGFSFQTSNGILRKEFGRLVNVGLPDEHLKVTGIYSYTDAAGNFVIFRYTADENGYHVQEGLPSMEPFSPLPSSAVATLLG